MKQSAFVLLSLLAVSAPPLSPVRAQEPAGEPCAAGPEARVGVTTAGLTDLVRALELAGRAVHAAGDPGDPMIRRGDRRVQLCEEVPIADALPRPSDSAYARLLPVRALALSNTGYARDVNDGALWAGRGLATALELGVTVRAGPFSAALAPRVIHQSNADFETVPVERAGQSPLSYPHDHRIDWPQRPGEGPFWTLDPGQSYARVDLFGAAAGVSTENMWWGPGIRNALIMTSTAPGFPHLFLGTSEPADVRIGDLYAEVLWGRLSESEHFDDDPANDHRLFHGLVGTFRPRFLPGLTLGATRIFYVTIPPDGLASGDYLRVFEGLFVDQLLPRFGSTSDGTDQMLSLFAHWVFPESDFETYVEWGRTDRNRDMDDFLQEPDHSQAYILGFQKVIPGEDRWFRIGGELTHLEESITQQDRGLGPWYVHGQAEGGYTHEGQLLGAAIGPGSSAQFITLDMIDSWGMLGIYGERIRHDSDTYYENYSRWLIPRQSARPADQRYCGCYDWTHDVEFTGGLRAVLLWRDLELTPELAYTYRMHRNFRADDRNWLLRLGVAWLPEVPLTR